MDTKSADELYVFSKVNSQKIPDKLIIKRHQA
jgi:hypothetical protein